MSAETRQFVNDHALWRQDGHDGWGSTGTWERCVGPLDHVGDCHGNRGSVWRWYPSGTDQIVTLGDEKPRRASTRCYCGHGPELHPRPVYEADDACSYAACSCPEYEVRP